MQPCLDLARIGKDMKSRRKAVVYPAGIFGVFGVFGVFGISAWLGKSLSLRVRVAGCDNPCCAAAAACCREFCMFGVYEVILPPLCQGPLVSKAC